MSKIQLIQKISDGKNSTVYKARVGNMAEFIAIKIIPKNKIEQNPNIEKRVENEKQLLTSIKHPNIINLYQILTSQNQINMTYEFCEHENLSKFLLKNSFSEERDILIILCDVASALAELKRSNIVHRDIKPQSLYIKEGIIKLGNFKNSVRMGSPDPDSFYTSPFYLAPEVLRSFEFSTKSDIYALGMVVLELVLGSLPFVKGDNNQIIEQKIRFNFKGFPKKIEISPRIVQLLEGMTNPDQNYRLGIEQVCYEIGLIMGEYSMRRDQKLSMFELEEEIRNHQIENIQAQSKKFIEGTNPGGDKPEIVITMIKILEFSFNKLFEHNNKGQYSITMKFIADKYLDLVNNLSSNSNNGVNSEGIVREIEKIQNRKLNIINERSVLMRTLTPQPPNYLNCRYDLNFEGSQLIDLLIAKAAYNLKYESDLLLADIKCPIEFIKERIVISAFLLRSIDLTQLSLNFDPSMEVQDQPFYLGFYNLDFRPLHQKLTSLIVEFEYFANYNLEQIFNDNYSKSNTGTTMATPGATITAYNSATKKFSINTNKNSSGKKIPPPSSQPIFFNQSIASFQGKPQSEKKPQIQPESNLQRISSKFTMNQEQESHGTMIIHSSRKESHNQYLNPIPYNGLNTEGKQSVRYIDSSNFYYKSPPRSGSSRKFKRNFSSAKGKRGGSMGKMGMNIGSSNSKGKFQSGGKRMQRVSSDYKATRTTGSGKKIVGHPYQNMNVIRRIPYNKGY